MDGKSTSTLSPQRTDSSPRQPTRADGRREVASAQIHLLPGISGAARRLALALLGRFDLLWRVNGSVRGSWLGQPVAIPLIFGNGIQHIQTSERWMYEVIQRLLQRSGGAFVDVGANIGQTLLKVKMADRGRAYYGFEPNPAAVAYIHQLVHLNKFESTMLFPVGLSDHTGIVTLFLKDDVDPSASIVAGFRPPHRYAATKGVSVHRGDDVLESIANLRVGTLKIDVEGAELDVIAGCQRTIARDRPFIICEILPVYDPASESGRLRLARQQTLRGLLGRLDYDLYRITTAGSFEKIADFSVDSDITRCNYLFLPAAVSAADL